jgi:hypothetical protein
MLSFFNSEAGGTYNSHYALKSSIKKRSFFFASIVLCTNGWIGELHEYVERKLMLLFQKSKQKKLLRRLLSIIFVTYSFLFP